MKITAATKVCAVIGDPVSHSLSPAIHNAAFQATGLPYVYVAFHVRRGRAGEAARAVRELGIRGLSVTIPHKLDIIAHLDRIDEVTAGIGSVNTVLNEDGTLLGTSTDGPGALRALEASGVQPAGKRILLLGSGGAARAIAFSLSTLTPPCRVRILGIEKPEREKLLEDLRARTSLNPTGEDLTEETLKEGLSWAQIVIHATPVGMAGYSEESLIDPQLIRSDHVIFDVVYTPLQTKLLRDAKARGAKTVPGVGMFVHQAALQFELWTGRKAPLQVMTDTITGALRET